MMEELILFSKVIVFAVGGFFTIMFGAISIRLAFPNRDLYHGNHIWGE
jgi:hypothetical protein